MGTNMSNFRTDRNNNPTAFTTDIARQAGLIFGHDYVTGEGFKVNDKDYWTAKLLGDPIDLTIMVIDRLGFYNKSGNLRWTYIGIPRNLWLSFSKEQKIRAIRFMYEREGGTALNIF